MRLLGLLLVAAATAVLVKGAVGQEAYTTRFETRPYYGAVVTIEHGVRVYRPVPPTLHMIIDPREPTAYQAQSPSNRRPAVKGVDVYGPPRPNPE